MHTTLSSVNQATRKMLGKSTSDVDHGYQVLLQPQKRCGRSSILTLFDKDKTTSQPTVCCLLYTSFQLCLQWYKNIPVPVIKLLLHNTYRL